MSEKTLSLIALAAIGVTRNGKTVYPEIGNRESGKPFDFTEQEVADIRELEDKYDTKMLREPYNEGGRTLEKTELALKDMDGDQLKAKAAELGLTVGDDVKSKAALIKLIKAKQDENAALDDEL